MTSTLPASWVKVRLGDLVDYGAAPKVEPRDIPADAWVLELEDVEKDTSRILRRLTLEQRESKSTKSRFRVGDVLYGKLRPYLNKIVLADQDGYCTTEIVPIKAPVGVDPRFLLYALKRPEFLEYVTAVSHGMNMPRLGAKAAEAAEIPLAPSNEQKRIADKLDQLQATVDACKARLDSVTGILKRFRQSVLASAVSGELTEGWRRTVRETPEAIEWSECKVKEAGRIQLGRQRSPKYHQGPNMRPYLRVQNVFEDRIDLTDVMEMDFPPEDFERYRLEPGDILLNEGQSPEFLGRPAMYRGELPGACFTNTLIRFQAYPHVQSEFALIVFRHHMHSGRYRREGAITTNIAHLGLRRFGEVEFPLPSIQEQKEIAHRVESLFALADALEAKVNAARARVEKLIQSLLAKAFRGELVPQDPNDEPATELLARIKAERAARPKKNRRKQVPA